MRSMIRPHAFLVAVGGRAVDVRAGRVAESDQGEAVHRTQLVDELARGHARHGDLVAARHRAGRVEHDREVDGASRSESSSGAETSTTTYRSLTPSAGIAD
jgi:hypothetical protein